MIPTYGVEKSVLSWIGPREAAQDFVVDDTWYEIKTIASSSEVVTILLLNSWIPISRASWLCNMRIKQVLLINLAVQ